MHTVRRGTPAKDMDLAKYWVRYGGSSLEIFRIKKLSELSPAESLLSSLLHGNDDVSTMLNSLSLESSDFFVELVKENSLASYVLSQSYKSGVDTQLGELHNSSKETLLSILSKQAAWEAVTFERFDNHFVKFLDITADYNDRIIWLKGIVTSRTIYGEPSYRLSSDFDCFLEPKFLTEFDALLRANHFTNIAGDAGFCNQLGVGPVNKLADLFLAPSSEFVPSGVIGYQKPKWPILDLKFNPLDRGIRMVELARLIDNSTLVQWRSRIFLAPDLIDQLLVSLVHFEKDRFKGWKQLLDLRLLTEKMNENPTNWTEFVRRSKVEGIATICWAGLALTHERLKIDIPADILSELTAPKVNIAERLFRFTLTPLFYWNTSSLPMLLASACFSDDRERKANALKSSLLPSKTFLESYYFDGKKFDALQYLIALILHWSVLLLPGGVVRRTFGKFVWKGDEHHRADLLGDEPKDG